MDSWLPTEECVILPAATLSKDGNTLSWTAVEDARCYVIFKDGVYLTNLTEITYDTNGEEGVYTVRAANLNGGLGKVSNEVGIGIEVVNENQDYTPVAQTGVKVRLTRTIKAGNWSTFILPFALNETQIKEPSVTMCWLRHWLAVRIQRCSSVKFTLWRPTSLTPSRWPPTSTVLTLRM